VAGSEASLEDLRSRNGTFLGDDPVTTPRRLRDGDEIRLGTVIVTFHRLSDGRTTEALPPRRVGT